MITRPIPKSARVGVWGLAGILLAAAVLLPMARAQDRVKQTADMSGAEGGSGIRSNEPVSGQRDPSLVAWWKLDEGAGTVVADSSGNGIDGNFVGNPKWVAGVHGGALLFDGASSVNFGNPRKAALTGPLTIACWIKPKNLGTTPRVIGGSQDRALLVRDGAYALKTGGPNLRFTTPWIRDHEATKTFLTMGRWQHVAVTFQPGRAGGCVFYLDGRERDRQGASVLKTGTGPVRLANDQWPGGQSYAGAIDDVRLYSRVLTAGEVQEIMGDTSFASGTQPTHAGGVSLPDAFRVYTVNRIVADFPPGEDLSTPEAAYAAINRIDRNDRSAWQKVSTPALAERMARDGNRRGAAGETEWAGVLANARILQVIVWNKTQAAVLAELPQAFSSKEIAAPIDVRYLEVENGRWLNTGNDRFWTVEEANATFMARSEGAQQKAAEGPEIDPVAAMGQLKQLALTAIMYAEDHKGSFASDLAELKPYFGDDTRFAQIREEVVYLGKGVKRDEVTSPAARPLAYRKTAPTDDGMVVAFFDGHVEIVKGDRLTKLGITPKP